MDNKEFNLRKDWDSIETVASDIWPEEWSQLNPLEIKALEDNQYLSGRYPQTVPSRGQNTSEFFFLRTGMCTEKRDSIYIQICILLSRESPEGHETTSNKRICKVTFGKKKCATGTNT